MLGKKNNGGMLFNHFPTLLFKAIPEIKSESDLLVKIVRGVTGDKRITHGHQIARNVKKGKIDIETLSRYFGVDVLEKVESLADGVETEHLAAWFQIKCMVESLRNSFSSDSKLDEYWQFLDAHLTLEYQFIKQHYGKEDLGRELCSFFMEWLLVDSFNPLKPNPEQGAAYFIHMVMYWAALYELFLDISTGSTDHSILHRCLPHCEDKGNEVVFNFSSEVFLFKFKQSWAQERYDRKDVSWSTLYKDVVRAQLKDPSIYRVPFDDDSVEMTNPDTQTVKKRFSRWRSGHLFSLKDARRNLSVLRLPVADAQNVIGLEILIFINMFTVAQKELVLENHVSPALVVRSFERYPEFKSLVQRRFVDFIETGQLVS